MQREDSAGLRRAARRVVFVGMIVSMVMLFSNGKSRADWTVGADKADSPKDVAAAMRETLDQKKLTLKNGDTVTAEFWLRSDIPSGADADQVKLGLGVSHIPETTLLGVVRFPAAFTDYRKQSIPAGIYTLRLVNQPDIGDHKETAPHKEFAMLSPAAKDRDADTLDVKDLLKLSKLATAADHPAVMLLYPAKKAAAEPKLVDKGDGVTVLELKRNVTASGGSTTIGFGIVVNGASKSR